MATSNRRINPKRESDASSSAVTDTIHVHITAKPETDLERAESKVPLVDELAIADHDAPENTGPPHEDSNVNWRQASLVMIAETVSLGILSLPLSISKLGFVPGGLLIFVLGMISIYTGYVIFQFKMAYPQVTSFADAGELIAGKVGRWVGDITLMFNLVFIMAAHVLAFSVMLNTLTNHGACTVVFTLIGFFLCIIFTLPRTLKTTSHFSRISCASICTAAIVALIDISVRHAGEGTSHIVVPTRLASYAEGSLAVSNMILAFTGHMAYFSIISEMKEPRDFSKALYVCQGSTLTLYLVVGIVIYYFAGQNVASPALGSASVLVSKIAYGAAIPTIIVAGVIAAMVASKTTYQRVWRQQPEIIRENSARAWLSWVAIVVAFWMVAWLIANVIPVFAQLIALVGAALGTWICLGFPAIFWLFLNRRCEGSEWRESLKASYGSSWKQIALAVFNGLIFLIGLVICVSGVYGSIVSISDNPPERKPFSCANNAI